MIAFCFVEYIGNKLAMIFFWLVQIFYMWWTRRTLVHPPSLHEVYQLLTSVGGFFLFNRNSGSRFATNFFCLESLVVGLSLVLWWCLNPVVSVLAHFSNSRTTGFSSKPWFDSIGSMHTHSQDSILYRVQRFYIKLKMRMHIYRALQLTKMNKSPNFYFFWGRIGTEQGFFLKDFVI